MDIVASPRPRSRLLRRHVALPSDHGSWVFLLSPLAIGLVAGGRLTAATPFVVLGAVAVFLLRQPTSLLVKIFSGRRPRDDWPAAAFWTALYGLAGLLSAAALIAMGFAYLLYLFVPALPVYAYHLFLVSRRAERRQMGVEVAGSGILALAAPAALWAGLGRADPMGWWLWGLVWLQSAASILYAYLRLEQRAWAATPPPSECLRRGWLALTATTFSMLAVGAVAAAGVVPAALMLPYLVQWLESLWGTLRPAVGQRPVRIGMRQLIVSSLFTILFMVTWRL